MRQVTHERGNMAGWRRAVPLRTTPMRVDHIPVAGQMVRVECAGLRDQRRRLRRATAWRVATLLVAVALGAAIPLLFIETVVWLTPRLEVGHAG